MKGLAECLYLHPVVDLAENLLKASVAFNQSPEGLLDIACFLLRARSAVEYNLSPVTGILSMWSDTSETLLPYRYNNLILFGSFRLDAWIVGQVIVYALSVSLKSCVNGYSKHWIRPFWAARSLLFLYLPKPSSLLRRQMVKQGCRETFGPKHGNLWGISSLQHPSCKIHLPAKHPE